MTTLREAQEQGKLDEFIAERKGHPKGDHHAMHRIIRSMAGTSKEAPAASKPDQNDG